MGHIRINCSESESNQEVAQLTQENVISDITRREFEEESAISDIESDTEDDSDCDICLMVSEGSVADKKYWIYDSAATCHMGPSLAGCTNIKYVNDRVTVGNRSQAV